jgi:hypothetical protein
MLPDATGRVNRFGAKLRPTNGGAKRSGAALSRGDCGLVTLTWALISGRYGRRGYYLEAEEGEQLLRCREANPPAAHEAEQDWLTNARCTGDAIQRMAAALNFGTQ